MRVIHVLRKPCSREAGTVAANVLRCGTGALNIDASRVGTAADVPSVHATRKSDYPQSYTGNGAGWGRTRGGYAGDEVHWEPKGGRWPANLVLQHLDGCRREGTREVPTDGHFPATRPAGSKVAGASGHVGQQGLEERSPKRETVAAWTCAEGCPVAALDEQSGTLAPQGGQKKKDTKAASFLGTGHGGAPDSTFYGDTGGASRFFRQFGGGGS